MSWDVEFEDSFSAEFDDFSEAVQDAILAKVKTLQVIGPQLGRPHVDTLAASKHPNMKEIRCDADNGVWRVAFAFDPKRKAILLVAGDKSGVNQKRFYKKLIEIADERFQRHLEKQKGDMQWVSHWKKN